VKGQPPIELGMLGLDVDSFTRSDAKSWRGPCPRCGGHRRFLIFTDKEFPHWNFACDGCSFAGWATELNHKLKEEVTAEQRRIWVEQAKVERQHREAEERQKLAEFSNSAIWREGRERMQDVQRAWWRGAGIPDSWQDWWRLGYVPDKRFEHNGEFYVREAYTIPKFDLCWAAVNTDYRLVDPPAGVGKYRPEYGLPAAPFLTRPDFKELSPVGIVLVVEGSKKAMVTAISGRLVDVQIIGVPGSRSWCNLPAKLKDIDQVVIILDPDAKAAARDLAEAIGKNARYINLPDKIDELFLKHHMTAREFGAVVQRNGRMVG